MSNPNEQELTIKNDDVKLNKIIQEHSDQMLTMVDVINVYDAETQKLNKKISELESQCANATSIFNNQLLLFTLTAIIFYLLYLRSK